MRNRKARAAISAAMAVAALGGIRHAAAKGKPKAARRATLGGARYVAGKGKPTSGGSRYAAGKGNSEAGNNVPSGGTQYAAGKGTPGAGGKHASGGVRYTAVRGKPGAWQNASQGKGQTEGESALWEDGLTVGRLRGHLLRLFRLYEDSEFEELADFLGESGDSLREFAAANYSEALLPYIRKNMREVMALEGDDGIGREPHPMADGLFGRPACLIGWQPVEISHGDRLVLCRDVEVWMLAGGEFASVHCISLKRDGRGMSYRFVDSYIRERGDIPIRFGELEFCLTQARREEAGLRAARDRR